jgi:hypothetical protein
MTYNIWDSCFLVPGFNRVECFGGIQAGAAVLQFLGTIGAMALTLWIWRRSAASDTRQTCALANTYAAVLEEVLVALKGAAETQQNERIAAHSVELTEICHFGRSIRVDLLPPLSVYEFFKLRALAAKAERRARFHIENREVRTFEALRSDFENYRAEAKFLAEAFAKDMDASTTDPTDLPTAGRLSQR